MMKRFTLFFVALMMTLGVCAQASMPEQIDVIDSIGRTKGYYPFAAEVTKMRKLGGDDVLTSGMQILIQHKQADNNGWYLTIYSKAEQDQTYHGVFMQEKAMGVSTFQLEHPDDAPEGIFLLQTAHMRVTGEVCYLGSPAYDSFNTSQNYPGSYEFRWVEGKGWIVVTGNRALHVTLDANNVPQIGYIDTQYNNNFTYFDLCEVQETKGTIKYVESIVKLTGAAGNVFTTEHAGWSDFYEFIKESNAKPVYGQIPNNYAVTLSNVYYNEESNEITGGIKFPFSVSGKIAQIPVHLCSYGNEDKRFTVGENNTVKVITRPATPTEGDGWFKNQENQWYIIPSFDEDQHLVYSIQNVATKQYLYTELTSTDLKLSVTPTYFKLNSGAPGGQVRFSSYYQGPHGTYVSYLCESSSKGNTTTSTYLTNVNFAVPRVSGEEAGGYDAIGFTRTYHSDTYFWDGGEIAMDDAPDALKEVFEDENHEGYNTQGSQHRIYTANTGIYVPKMGDVTVTFKNLGGTDKLTILGVDIVDALGGIVSSEYYLGYAGTAVDGNVYEVKDVPVGNYFLRYWICNRTDDEANNNHNLSRNSGKIVVTGADYYLTYSDAPTNGAFSSNSTWYRMRLSDGLEKYISAQPNYVDADNNLMLTNNTPPNDYAGLWAIVGDEENGYKFYNRAWGPEYAMKTVGEDGSARTYMVPVAEASTYDIVQQDRSTKDYKFYVKLHGTDNNYLQNNGTDHLSTSNDAGALGDAASVMTFETLNMEVFEANTEIVKNALAEKWTPWTDDDEVADIIDDFAQLMLNRNSFALLNGKVFKFANQGGNNRTGKLLGVNASNQGAGLTATGNSEDYMQFIDNGNGTFKLFHIATARYLGVPNGAVTTTKSTEAAAYTYTFQDATQKEQLTFQTSGQTLHLQNSFVLKNYGDNDAASRWVVSYGETEAQDLGAVAILAQEVYAKVTAQSYQENAGKEGYAPMVVIEQYVATIQSLSALSVEAAKIELEKAMKAIADAESLATYKKAALDFLNATPTTVGYPIDEARTTLKTAIDEAITVEAVYAALQAFKVTKNVNMPVSGKAYVIRNVQTNGTKYMLSSAYTNAYLPAATDDAADNLANVFVCRVTDNGYVFVNASHGEYMLFHGKNATNPFESDGFSDAYSDKNDLKLNSQAKMLFGTLSIAGKRNRLEDAAAGYATMTIATDGNMDANSGQNEATYSGTYSSLFMFEEVNYTLNQVTLNAVSDEDKLLSGIYTGETIATFSASYATVIPEGVTAYYGREHEQDEQIVTLYLTRVQSNVIPAKQGVILIGEENMNKVMMLPVAGETVLNLNNNALANSATGKVIIGNNDYILTRGSQGIGIYKAKAGSTLNQGKAYVSLSGQGNKSLVLRFGGMPTSIDGEMTATRQQQVIYDFSGRRVNEVTKAGLYIVNGKKVFIK